MTARRTTTLLASAAVLAGALALAPTTAGGQTASCEQPYSPVAFAETYPAQEALPEVPGVDVTVPFAFVRDFDSDGDGTIDTVSDEETGTVDAHVLIERGDGTVRLFEEAESFDVFGVGDIDGDGRDEFGVAVRAETERTYLVPGATPTGSRALEDAGILMSEVAGGLALVPDSSDRLLVVTFGSATIGDNGTTTALDAGDALALGPGGDASSTPDAVTIEGFPKIKHHHM